ncbi:MAG: hypothetical protein HKN11_14470 [Rhizobiales bacterium]|nr:hypothetical protein [Hyphomicrobiales bacterium]
MKLTAPSQLVALLSVLLIVLAVLSSFVAVPVIGGFQFEVAIFGYLVLLAGNLLEGL